MTTKEYITKEIADLKKRQAMLKQQREAVTAQLYACTGSLETLGKLLKEIEEPAPAAEAPPVPPPA